MGRYEGLWETSLERFRGSGFGLMLRCDVDVDADVDADIDVDIDRGLCFIYIFSFEKRCQDVIVLLHVLQKKGRETL